MGREQRLFSRLSLSKIADIARIRNTTILALQEYTQRDGFNQLLRVLMSPITGPLNHVADPAQIVYDGKPLQLTASMIFHKQRALEKIFLLAPNLRPEKPKIKSSENHSLEFFQFDLEFRVATTDDVMAFLNSLYVHVFERVRHDAGEALFRLSRRLPKMDERFLEHSRYEWNVT